LLFPIVLATEKIRGVRLQLGPEIFAQMILRSGIPRDGTAQFIGFPRRQGSSQTAWVALVLVSQLEKKLSRDSKLLVVAARSTRRVKMFRLILSA
jgi:hypothetical protein